MCCENYGRCHRLEANSILSQIKPLKDKKKNLSFGIYNSKLKPTILKEVKVKHYISIIAGE